MMTNIFYFHLTIFTLIIFHQHGVTGEEMELSCPLKCKCYLLEPKTDCSHNRFSEIPNSISSDVEILDFSYNNFKYIPKSLSIFPNLQYLSLSHNNINGLYKANLSLSSLRVLDLSNNNIKSGHNIDSSALNFTLIISELNLSNNPITYLSPDKFLKSDSLEVLKLSNCSLRDIPKSFLAQLTNLKTLNLSNNKNLKILKKINSTSLEKIDLSNCDLDETNLSGFENLRIAVLRGNRISDIKSAHFTTTKLEELDLSDNTIKHIKSEAFSYLPNLRLLNLSTNVFINLDKDTFTNNTKLQILSISRTYLQTMIQCDMKSLKYLDLSRNEIQNINSDSLTIMPSLQTLNLANNLLSKLPNQIKSLSLLELDLSNNRIASIQNDSLTYLHNLRQLNLAGNKLTSFHPNYLPKDLIDLRLDDNLWRCECTSKEFKELFNFLADPPGLTNMHTLKCNSPEMLLGRTWHEACQRIWYNLGHGLAKTEKLWLYVIFMIIAMSVIFAAVMCIKRVYRVKMRQEELDRQRRVSEAHERIQRLRTEQLQQIEVQQMEAQQNAPDPRELVRPPSYHEAIRMPRLDGSYTSLGASRPSLVGSNPELAKNRERSGSTSKRKARNQRYEEERRYRRRRRRRNTAGSSNDITEAVTDNDIQMALQDDENESDTETMKRLVHNIRRVHSVDEHLNDNTERGGNNQC